MKKRLLIIGAMLALTLSGNSLCAQNDQGNQGNKGNKNDQGNQGNQGEQGDQNDDGQGYRPDFNTWTEQQIVQWEDSVKEAVFPVLKDTVISVSSDNSTSVKSSQKNNLMRAYAPIVNNTYVPNSIDIDRNKAVGEIPMTSGVSPTGVVTYNVPIEVYPGIHEMQPQLSIAYNSMGGNGVLGAGWDISGLSTINRGNRSIYYDTKTVGVALTKDDAFYLDGTRLIKLSETSTQIKYESEQGNIKATANLNGTTVKYFDVYFPNGTKATYGYTTNTGTNYLEYPLTSISDLFDNSISYIYEYVDNHYRIIKISYANASVEFSYTTRSDILLSYSAGLKVREDKLLQKIICKYGNTVLRNYDLSYIGQRYTSFLSQIGYSASNGSSFNPLKFYYGENSVAYAFTKSDTQLLEWYSWTNPNDIRVSKGKFEYNTQNDGLMVVPGNEYFPYWQHYRGSNLFQHSQNRFDNQYKGTEKILLHAGFGGNWASPMPNLTTGAGFIDIFAANTDGKGEDEVVKVNNVISGTNDQIIFNVYSANLYSGLGFKYPQNSRTFNFPTVLTDADGGKSVHAKFYFTGDFNGDGKTEILAVSCNQPFGWTEKPTKCYLFDLDSNVKLYEGQPFAYNVTFVGSQMGTLAYARQNSDRLFVFDYDGDGKSDICLINANGTYIYTFDISGSTYTMRQVAAYTGLKRADLADKQLMIGEFNGDGIPDFLLSPKVNASDWYIYFSMGNGQFEKVSIPNNIGSPSATSNYLLQDVNSDGLTDLIRYDTNGFYIYKAANGSFTSSESYTSFNSTGPLFFPTNINARFNFNQLIALKDGIVTKFSYPRNDTKEKLLTGSVTSLGVVNKNYYQMLNESYPIYTQGVGATFPYENFNGSLYVTSGREQYFNGQKNESLSYSYENAVVHKQGLGFRGFGKIYTYDNIRGRSAYQTFDPYNYSVLKEDDSPTTKTTNTWSVNVASNRVAKVRMTNQSVLDKLKGITVTSGYTYNDYGNPLTENINYGGGITATVSNAYSNNTGETGYLLGFLTDQTKTVNRNGSTWSQRSYIPAFLKGQPSVIVSYANGNQTAYESFSYDAQGNAISYGVKSYTSANTLTTNYTYDSYGRLTKETDPLGFNTTYEYNASNGSLSNVKNHKEQATAFTYDAFGRISQMNYPTGAIEVNSLFWTTSERGTNTLYCNYRHPYGKPWTKTFYDALGRETSSIELILGDKESGADKLYDNYGRLWKVSLPFITGSSPTLWNEYQYDSYDRPTKFTEASGRVTTNSYSGNTVTNTEDGIATKQTFDNQGNLIQIDDPGGTIAYNLRPDGQPSSIVAPGNVTTSFTYDSYGRRLSIVDPSAGTKSNTYDAAGNIALETNANNKSISYQYDTYNRLKQKVNGYIITYAYNADGLLASETSSNETSTAYQYDTYGRLYKEKEMTDLGRYWLEKTYTYSAGNLLSTQYASKNGTIVTENYYYESGRLKEIKLNEATSIWKLNTVNVFNQPTGVTTGSFNRTYSYNAYGLPTGRAAGSFQNQTYSFDASQGNLTYRKDNIKNVQENFTYDNLNRLTGYSGKTAAYAANGNINSKTEVGTFQYATSGKPYALSGVTSPTHLIPQRNQTITYTAFDRPASITEGEYKASFFYNSKDERTYMWVTKNGAKVLNRTYLSGCYEIDDRAVGGMKEKLYLGGDFYTAPAVYVKEGTGNWNIYYLCRDNLGSITHITNSSGSVVQELSYDAWGQLRDPANQTVYAPGSEPELFLGRGYTGHEHLPQFALINMNARLYDAALGRFLSPDPFVQSPNFTQNFNRYSYALNNPLRYTDKNGQWIILDNFVAGFFKGLFRGDNPFQTAWRDATNDAKVWGGLFNGNFKQIASRFTWELPQTLVGFTAAQGYISFGDVKKVDYWGGATTLQNAGGLWGAFTLGSYIIGDNSLRADPNNTLFQHEYGHYLQSQSMGWAYLPRVAIPSLMDGALHNDGNHIFQPYEQDANRRAFEYFNKYVDGFYKSVGDQAIYGNSKGWNFYDNPLDINHTATKGKYYDYKIQMGLINNSLTLHSKWFDYFDPLGLFVGIGNGIYYNNHRVTSQF